MAINLYHGDCIQAMAKMPDNAYNLAIVDPPYGIDIGNKLAGIKRKSGNGLALKTHFDKKEWDIKIPPSEYFTELFRVSKNQIIWGANYMVTNLPNSMGWIVWDKDNGSTNFSDCELAFTSFNVALRKFTFTWNGMLQGNMKNKEIRIHPTQKPVALYKWLLKNYAKPGDKILDTHGGSMSIAIACHDMGFDLDLWELDEDYYKTGVERYQNHIKQGTLFDAKEVVNIKQEQIF